MHAQVTSQTPGDCPICRMQLEPKAHGTAAGGGAQAETSDRASDGDPAPATFSFLPERKIRTLRGARLRHDVRDGARDARARLGRHAAEVGQALFYRDEIALLDPKEEGLFFPSTNIEDGKPAGIKVARIDEAPMPWDDATRADPFSHHLEGAADAGSDRLGEVRHQGALGAAPCARPRSSDRRADLTSCWSARTSSTFTKRPIQIGSVLYEHAAVLSGLEVGERIATLNTFALDAERRFSGRNEP